MSFSPVSYFEYPVCDICKILRYLRLCHIRILTQVPGLGYAPHPAPVFHNLKQIIFGLYSNLQAENSYGGENRRPVMGLRF